MKALPFPCIRPARDRVLEALPQMGGILSSNDACATPSPTLMLKIRARRITRTNAPESRGA